MRGEASPRRPRTSRARAGPRRSHGRKYLFLFCILYLFLVLSLAAYGIPRAIIDALF
jgi:hypothetical protein